jgi:hypothetical protein
VEEIGVKVNKIVLKGYKAGGELQKINTRHLQMRQELVIKQEQVCGCEGG